MEERKLDVRRKGRNNSYRFDQEQEDPLMAIGTALLFRSAFGRVHVRTVRNTDTEDTDYGALREKVMERAMKDKALRNMGAIRSKKHLKCSR